MFLLCVSVHGGRCPCSSRFCHQMSAGLMGGGCPVPVVPDFATDVSRSDGGLPVQYQVWCGGGYPGPRSGGRWGGGSLVPGPGVP